MRILAILLISLLGLLSYTNASSPAECDACGIVVNYIEGFLLKNKTQSEIETELEKACNLMSPEIRPTCDTLVEGYTEVIMNLIFMKENPKTICQQLKLCEPPSKNYFKIDNDRLRELKDGLLKKASIIGRSRYDDTKECSICKLISGDIIVLAKMNKTQEEIITELNTACSAFKEFEKECVQMVEQYVPMILSVIETENPTQICDKIGLCASQQQKHEQHEQHEQPNNHNLNRKPIGRVLISKNY